LAVALAERIRGATIAIDADFQRPTLAGHLGAPPERDGQGPGLSDVLRGDADWKEAVRPTGVDRLAVLPGGRSRPAGGHRFGPLLDELRARTPLLLVSLGPIAHSGAAELAGLCEGTCLFVALGRTTRREARAAVRALHAAGSLVLGSIAVG
jgi:Mrp family chromosome partitioning ATPase